MKLPEITYKKVKEFLEVQEYIRKKGHLKLIPRRYHNVLKIWEGTTIPFIDYMHWDEVRKQRRQIKADYKIIIGQIYQIIDIWKNEVVPTIVGEWEH